MREGRSAQLCGEPFNASLAERGAVAVIECRGCCVKLERRDEVTGEAFTQRLCNSREYMTVERHLVSPRILFRGGGGSTNPIIFLYGVRQVSASGLRL